MGLFVIGIKRDSLEESVPSKYPLEAKKKKKKQLQMETMRRKMNLRSLKGNQLPHTTPQITPQLSMGQVNAICSSRCTNHTPCQEEEDDDDDVKNVIAGIESRSASRMTAKENN